MGAAIVVHFVTGLKLGKVNHYPANRHSEEFYTRMVTATTAEGGEISLDLFSNTADGLLTEAEKAEEAMVCAMAEQAAQEGGILFAKEEDVPF